MGIFTRFRDIINSNLNAMLDKAEDPEKLIKLMIREMEDTLVELKASCAGVMAQVKKIERQLADAHDRAGYWGEKAELAVSKGRDDLAREALLEKRNCQDRADRLERERLNHQGLIDQYKEDIQQLEDKLSSAREKQRILVQRHIRARKSKRAQEDIRRAESTDAMFRFEQLENRIERMEAEADLVNFGRKPSLEEEMENLVLDDEIEQELKDLKSSLAKDREEA